MPTQFLNSVKQQKKKVKVVGIGEPQLLLTIRTKMNDLFLFSYLVCAVLAGQLLSCPNEAVADPLSKYLL